MTEEAPRPGWPAGLRRFLTEPGQSTLEEAFSRLRERSESGRGRDASLCREVLLLLFQLAQGHAGQTARSGPRLAERFRALGCEEESATVLLLCKEAVIQEAEGFLSLPFSEQDRALAAGLEACQDCAEIAQRIRDISCAAAYLVRLANGLYTARRFADAHRALQIALTHWRSLEAEQPGVYRPQMAKTWIDLANVLEKEREEGMAAAAFRQAIALFRELHREDPARHGMGLATALNDFALFQLPFDRPESLSMFQESLSLLKGPAPHDFRMSVPLLRAKVLANLVEAVWSDESFRFWGGEALSAMAESEAESILREALGQPGSEQVRILCGVALARLGRFDEARRVLDQAEASARRSASRKDLAEVFWARTAVEQTATTDPEKWIQWIEPASQAISALEEALTELPPEERASRGRYKARYEVLYAGCLGERVRRGDAESAFHLLESMRRVDKLGILREPDPCPGEELAQAQEWVVRHKVAYLALQIIPHGAAFFALRSTGEVVLGSFGVAWRQRFFDLFQEIDEVAQAVSQCSGDAEPSLRWLGEKVKEKGSRLERMGAEVFDHLPEALRDLLVSEPGPLFISSYGDTQNFPFEFLRPSPERWLGLERMLPRVHSFRELRSVLGRQPDPASTKTMIAADPEGDLEHARSTAEELAPTLSGMGFDLVLERPILGVTATAKRLRKALESGIVLGLYCGHGDYDPYRGPFLRLAGKTRLEPAELAGLRLENHPILFFDCCQAGMITHAFGGRQYGLGPATIQAGASACLLSNRPVFDILAAELTRLFFKGLLKDKTVGAALLEARRQLAEICPSPVGWAFPMLIGNPGARLRS